MNSLFFRFLYILILVNTLQANKVVLTSQEKDFLKKHSTIKLGSDESWIPYIIKTDANSIIGYDNSILERVNELTGANFQLVTGKWKDILKRAKNKEIDGLSTSAIHEERREYFSFSKTYISAYKLLIVSSFNPKQIKSKKDLENKTVGIQEGNLFNEKIVKSIKSVNIIKDSSLDNLLDKLIKHEIDAVVEGDIFFYYTDKNKIHYSKAIDIFEDSKLDLVFSVRKDWPEAISILNKGLDAISKEERQKIKNEWFLNQKNLPQKDTSDEKPIYSKSELDFLSSIDEITMCIDPNWMPFEKLEEDKHIGISADYFKIIEKNINVPIRVIKTKTWLESLEIGEKRGCDIFSLVMSTPKREKYLNFTKPYLQTPLVLATKMDEIFITDITKLTDKKIGIIEGYAYGEILERKYPQLKLIKVKNLTIGLKKVQEDELFGFIGALSPVGYNIQKDFFGQLKITGKFDETWSLGIGVRNDIPILLSIFNKAIDKIQEEEHQKILNKWLSIKYEKVSYTYLYEIASVFIVIILIILFVNRKLSQEIKKRKEVEDYLNVIIKGSNLGTWTWNPQLDRNIINETWAEMLGYTKEEVDKVGSPFKFILEEDHKKIKDALDEHQRGDKELYEIVFRMKAKNGEIKWIYSCGSIVKRDANNQALLFAGVHQDITPKRNLEEELKKQNEFIIQQSRQAAMGEMLENIAHQWRQPLSLITSSASSVKLRKELDSLSDKDLDEAMSQIIKGGQYLSQTIEDFRNFFKKDKVLSDFSSEELFNNSLQFLKLRINKENIVVVKNIEETIISSYKNELVQALINIFSNAIDALEKASLDKKYIFIELKTDENYIYINIKDNALGINDEIITRIFDPYFTTKHQSQGTGIGLHMTRVIIEKHLKGSIKATNVSFKYNSIENKGALFQIFFPKNSKGV